MAAPGALAQALGGGLVLFAGARVAVLALIANWRDRSGDPGVATGLALFLAVLPGVAAVGNAAFSAGAAAAAAQPREALPAMRPAVTANMIGKGVGALAGGPQYAVRVNLGPAAVRLAAWLPFWMHAA